jgi:hypothetical protein
MKYDTPAALAATAEILDLARGWRRDGQSGQLHCLHCSASFDEDLVHPIAGGLATADRAMAEHLEQVHGGPFEALLALGSERTGLSDTQTALLRAFRAGRADREVALAQGGRSESTIRNHRFQMRRRESEARILVALMALLAEAEPRERRPIEYPADLPGRDERIDVTEAEALAIEARCLGPGGRILAWPKKQKDKLVILRRVAERFAQGRSYREGEVNAILAPLYADHVTIRRYLIEYRFLERKPDGSEYWRR